MDKVAGAEAGAGAATEVQQNREPSYTPPANEPQGLDPENEQKQAAEKKVEEKKPEGKVVKLPSSITPPSKPTGRFQARISDLVAQRDTVERENAQLRERLSRMGAIPRTEQPAPGSKTPTPAPQAGTGDTLNPEDFATYGEYVKALVESTLKGREESEKSAKAKAAFEEHRASRLASFNEQAAPLAAEYGEGFWDAITDPNLPISEAMADAVLELDELAPYTMLWLSAHKKEAAKMAQLNPRAATLAIGRLAAQLDYEIKNGGGNTSIEEAANGEGVQVNSSTPTGQQPQQIPAQQPVVPKPTPVPSIRGSAPSTLEDGPSDKDTVEEWLAKETIRMRKKDPNAKFYGAR